MLIPRVKCFLCGERVVQSCTLLMCEDCDDADYMAAYEREFRVWSVRLSEIRRAHKFNLDSVQDAFGIRLGTGPRR